MDQSDNDHFIMDNQGNVLLDMVKQHISNGLSFPYTSNYTDPIFQPHSDEDTSSNVEHEHDDHEQMPLPVVYKKRARIKFTQHQLDTLEATFQQHRYPTIDMIDDLVEQLNLPTQKITVWFQNRRARLKKSQQKLEGHQSFEKDDHQQYDSGIHLDEDVSRASSTSPPSNQFNSLPPSLAPPPLPASLPPPPSVSSSSHIGYTPTSSSPYYLPNPHQSFYNPMWQNFRYPYQTMMPPTHNLTYDFVNYNSPFVFQDMNSYQYPSEFHNQNYEE